MRTPPAGQSPFRLTRRAVILGMLSTLAACGATSTASAPPASAPSAAPQASAAASASAAPRPSTATSAAPASAAPASAAPASAAPASAAPQASAAAAPQGKPGGTIVIRWYTGDPPDLDPYLNVTFRAQEFAGFFYSRLLKFDSGPGIGPNAFTPVPDLAESYQISQDGLTYTFKLRANAKWQAKPPLNGRAVTADDVLYSFNRFRQVSPQKTNFDMVKEVKVVDPTTVTFTLNAPFAPFETTIASPMFWIMPKEVIDADGDARKQVVGSGPFIFDKFDKGVQIVAKKNPNYYFAGTPYVDEVDLLIIPEDATAVAGLRAQKIDINGVSATDRAALVASNPEIVMLDYPNNLLAFMYWKVDAPPFNDVRVRQAVSLALDRDEIIAVLYEGKGFVNNALPAGLQSFYLDPRSADMGPNAKYFKRDVDAAKKLLADAGKSNLKVPLISPLNAYGNTFNQSIELVIKQLKEAGIEATLQPQDYSAYIGSTFLGKFDPGVMIWGLETPFQEPHDYLYNMYHPKGVRNHANINDQKLTDMIEKQMTTIDKAARKALIFDIQRYIGEQQYYVQGPVGNTTIATQPWVKNFNYQSDYGRGGEYLPKLWLDGKK
jgi:peptide/nickel transport system substrate-binding protein